MKVSTLFRSLTPWTAGLWLLAASLPGPLHAAMTSQGAAAEASGAQEESLPPAPTAPNLGGAIRVAPEALGAAYAVVGAPKPEAGLEVSESEIQLALVQALGQQELAARKLDVFLEREINARIAAGASREDFAVDPVELDKQIETMRDQIRQQYPTLEVDFVLGQNGIQPGSLRSVTAQNQLFLQVFLPDDPKQWPALTREAILGRYGEAFVQQLTEAHEQRQAEGVVLDAAANQGQMLFRRLLRDAVVGTLEANTEVRTTADGLPLGVVLRVDGVDILTKDVFAAIAARVSADDVRRARKWAAKRAVVTAALKASGHWLDDEAFSVAWSEHQKPYEGSPITLEMVARQFKGFPSMDHYREHFRMQAAFERSIGEVTREELEAHLPRAQRMLGLEAVDAEVLLLSAYDFSTGQWKENGWATAEERARQVTQALVEGGGENWTELLEAHSDFWDAPLPANPSGAQMPARLNKGRFGPKNRNELAQVLRESEYTMFVEGNSVTDAIFFDVETGGLGGPWRGPFGYYVALVKGRTPARQAILLDGGRYEDLVRQDYLMVRFNAFADRVAQAAAIAQ